MSNTDPLAPMTMPLGDTVCGYCDSGASRQCPYHFNETGGAVGLMQFVPSSWGTA